jgi:hypothetical protein
MRPLGASVICVLGALAGSARAEQGADELGPPEAMHELPASDPCAALQATAEPAVRARCDKLATVQLERGTTAILYRVEAVTKAGTRATPRSMSFAIVVAAGGKHWLSPALELGYESKLCGRFTEPVDALPKLRVIRVQGAPAVALELRVVNRANTIDTGKCTTNGYRFWTRTAFLVCADHAGWSCLNVGFGGWWTPPCTASLGATGVLAHTCEQRDDLRFDR